MNILRGITAPSNENAIKFFTNMEKKKCTYGVQSKCMVYLRFFFIGIVDGVSEKFQNVCDFRKILNELIYCNYKHAYTKIK